jgi:hypothetical protein
MFEDSIEARAKVTAEAIDELVSTRPELKELFHRCNSLQQEEALRELLEEAVEQRRSLIEDSASERRRFFGFVSQEDAARLATNYMEVPWSHVAWLTNYLAANILAATVIEGRHHLGWGKRFIKLIPGPWNKVARVAFSILIFLFLLGLSIFLFDEHLAIFGWLVVAFMLWRYIGGSLLNLKTRRFFLTLTLIAEEINSGSYDREETIRRLRMIDDDRLFRFIIPTVTYSLLRLNETKLT